MKDHSHNLQTVRGCIAHAKAINPKKEPLTIEKLKSFSGCEHYTDEEAEQILRTFETLTSVMFELMTSEELSEDKPVKIIHMKPTLSFTFPNTNTKAA